MVRRQQIVFFQGGGFCYIVKTREDEGPAYSLEGVRAFCIGYSLAVIPPLKQNTRGCILLPRRQLPSRTDSREPLKAQENAAESRKGDPRPQGAGGVQTDPGMYRH